MHTVHVGVCGHYHLVVTQIVQTILYVQRGLEQVTLHKNDQVQKLLEYYMGKNTMERQNFIIDNLVVEDNSVDDDNEQLN